MLKGNWVSFICRSGEWASEVMRLLASLGLGDLGDTTIQAAGALAAACV
jgi:hypothetical protein